LDRGKRESEEKKRGFWKTKKNQIKAGAVPEKWGKDGESKKKKGTLLGRKI